MTRRLPGRNGPAAPAHGQRFCAGGLWARVTELEERLDFAERLLAQGEQADLLSRGAHR